MIKEMKKPYSKPLLFLAVISLLLVTGIITAGILTGKYTFLVKKEKGSLVLGVFNKLPLSGVNSKGIENILERAYESTKNDVAKKVSEAEGQLKSSLEKEISSYTESQIRSVQEKICRDWGISASTSTTITANPTP
ncbi:hypothetical protein A3D05_03440 [Candidatus Gottesmanbacteria bacterium RIFCSPHIGHO2_02_FULL_40_24]|uniref:Uncharacterized protein n=1 Tax=Candidatus Gottesmanbacteria bacterium RIFCSPHIGHO2_01_FULL_40_15 TaxID=1798376 RepID=A0A1F5Z0K0_9BACT|nr:MAG: hypothetical protein A2777_02565 [Candidatus Gottesmanbacteria bacterium RIFCSPHIGHO2_01_FULL_40_15]OGG17887.1 MAG: hypothetical protein A3D05_03440 [Candidatus Gottesmanbacteria bacterium RIFCSPHIGHO2_02_FULL_40_24]OGG21754.1 MAG: hypothetical protein A3B48_03590 [Candidatus Gottesmanbacteria bacterium RIFCSPLOWO2_01_FULL_40_10]OGG24728.1 MAG: hypothetical protein A3E42_01620 [Candidatus Gottesmanbacteria bacterium RIFCSPHIGHO2_12_FULL_40_13]OGG32006.1 MAG: hypothetical protein A3I80_0